MNTLNVFLHKGSVLWDWSIFLADSGSKYLKNAKKIKITFLHFQHPPGWQWDFLLFRLFGLFFSKFLDILGNKFLYAHFSSNFQIFGTKSFGRALAIKICNHFFLIKGTPLKNRVFWQILHNFFLCQKALFFRGIPLIFF